MDINYNTEKLIIIKYPPGAGGKFVSLCLGLHNKILPQHDTLAKEKILQPNPNVEIGYNHALNTFTQKIELNKHFEYGCLQLAGFNLKDLHQNPDADVVLSNNLWKELTNQKDYFFFMIDDYGFNTYKKYTKRKTIYITNYNWLLKARNLPIQSSSEIDRLKKILEKHKNNNCIDFDIETVQKQTSFQKEIDKVFKFLGLSFDSYSYLEKLRLKFLQTLKIGFDGEEKL